MINTYKKLFDVGQREVKKKIIYVSYNKGEHSLFSQSKQTDTSERGEKKSQAPWKVQDQDC